MEGKQSCGGSGCHHCFSGACGTPDQPASLSSDSLSKSSLLAVFLPCSSLASCPPSMAAVPLSEADKVLQFPTQLMVQGCSTSSASSTAPDWLLQCPQCSLRSGANACSIPEILAVSRAVHSAAQQSKAGFSILVSVLEHGKSPAPVRHLKQVPSAAQVSFLRHGDNNTGLLCRALSC